MQQEGEALADRLLRGRDETLGFELEEQRLLWLAGSQGIKVGSGDKGMDW